MILNKIDYITELCKMYGYTDKELKEILKGL
jgi:hypothetical protein